MGQGGQTAGLRPEACCRAPPPPRLQELLRAAAAPVHQHVDPEQQCAHRHRGGAAHSAHGASRPGLAGPGGWAGPWLVPGCPADLCPCSWAPAPPRRTRRPLPSCRCPCPRSETWTSPTMPAPCWPVLWRNSTRASSARMTAGGSHSRALEGSAFHEPRGHKAEAGQAWLAGVGETEVGTGSGRFWWMGPGPLPHVLLMYSQNQP